MENVLPRIVYCTKISVRLYHKGWQFSCHLICFKGYTLNFVLQNTYMHSLNSDYCYAVPTI